MDCAHVVGDTEQQQLQQQEKEEEEVGEEGSKWRKKPWLENISLDAWKCYQRTGPCKEDLTAKHWERWGEEDRKSQQSQQQQQTANGQNNTEGLEDSADVTDSNEAAAAAGRAGKAPGRVRPLIYIYNTPSVYQSRMYQYRKGKGSCSWRLFHGAEGNMTDGNHNGTPYAAELALLESLMMSKHRTLEPEEADFFYVPVAGTCFLEAVVAEGDWPWFYIDR
jgi:hypothetical protein